MQQTEWKNLEIWLSYGRLKLTKRVRKKYYHKKSIIAHCGIEQTLKTMLQIETTATTRSDDDGDGLHFLDIGVDPAVRATAFIGSSGGCSFYLQHCLKSLFCSTMCND